MHVTEALAVVGQSCGQQLGLLRIKHIHSMVPMTERTASHDTHFIVRQVRIREKGKQFAFIMQGTEVTRKWEAMLLHLLQEAFKRVHMVVAAVEVSGSRRLRSKSGCQLVEPLGKLFEVKVPESLASRARCHLE